MVWSFTQTILHTRCYVKCYHYVFGKKNKSYRSYHPKFINNFNDKMHCYGRVFPYLFCLSLELKIKFVLTKHGEKFPTGYDGHNLLKLYDLLRKYIKNVTSPELTENSIYDCLFKLNPISQWLGRYDDPGDNKYKQEKISPLLYQLDVAGTPISAYAKNTCFVFLSVKDIFFKFYFFLDKI